MRRHIGSEARGIIAETSNKFEIIFQSTEENQRMYHVSSIIELIDTYCTLS